MISLKNIRDRVGIVENAVATRVECDRQLLLAIHEAIISRDAAYHEKATGQKVKALELSEERNYAAMVELNDEVKAM